MNLLLDTLIFLWMQVTPDRLGEALPAVEDTSNRLLLSAASSWEIAIKQQLGKLSLPEAPETYVPSRMLASAVDGLAVEHSHALRVSALPPVHRDPFDRLLVAQAQLEDLMLVTADPVFDGYEVPVLTAG